MPTLEVTPDQIVTLLRAMSPEEREDVWRAANRSENDPLTERTRVRRMLDDIQRMPPPRPDTFRGAAEETRRIRDEEWPD